MHPYAIKLLWSSINGNKFEIGLEAGMGLLLLSKQKLESVFFTLGK